MNLSTQALCWLVCVVEVYRCTAVSSTFVQSIVVIIIGVVGRQPGYTCEITKWYIQDMRGRSYDNANILCMLIYDVHCQ